MQSHQHHHHHHTLVQFKCLSIISSTNSLCTSHASTPQMQCNAMQSNHQLIHPFYAVIQWFCKSMELSSSPPRHRVLLWVGSTAWACVLVEFNPFWVEEEGLMQIGGNERKIVLILNHPERVNKLKTHKCHFNCSTKKECFSSIIDCLVYCVGVTWRMNHESPAVLD